MEITANVVLRADTSKEYGMPNDPASVMEYVTDKLKAHGIDLIWWEGYESN